MTIATMADRTLSLAERAQAALLCWDMDDAHEAARAELIADVAAADRLARACIPPTREDDPADDQKAYDANFYEYEDALAAYLARVAQGVDEVCAEPSVDALRDVKRRHLQQKARADRERADYHETLDYRDRVQENGDA